MASRTAQDAEKALQPEQERFLSPHGTNGNSSGIAIAPVAPKTKLPLGIAILRRLIRPLREAPLPFYQFFILGITYFLYICYHISRKPWSVAKNVLHHKNCSDPGLADLGIFMPEGTPSDREMTWCSWAPFDGPQYKKIFSTLDFAYLMAYAIAMFFVGAVAEKFNLRYFLTGGMFLAGFFTVLFGLARTWEIHHLSFFIGLQVIAGGLQATGFPAVVALVSNWFGKQRRGLIFGFWNSHASLGNILGGLLASVWIKTNWDISFFVCGLVIVGGGLVCFLLVVVQPEDAGFPPQSGSRAAVAPPIVIGKNGGHELSQFLPKDSSAQIQVALPAASTPPVDDTPLKFWQAFMIPGVIEYSMCMFFAKGVAYTFLQWLPMYIKEAALFDVDSAGAGYISTAFDLGGIVGGIMVGAASDFSGARGLISGSLMFIAVPVLFLLWKFSITSVAAMIVLLVLSGLITVGPYSIIATAVAADLGTSLKGKSKAVASVSGIINGMGSFGAAFGPLIAGLLYDAYHWDAVFYFLIGAQFVASVCLSRLIYREIARMIRSRRNRNP